MQLEIDGVTLTLDPTNHYEQELGDSWLHRIKEALGILPEFMFGPHPTIAENMQENYQFFHSWTPADQHGAYIEEDCFCFPGDPEIYPLLKAEKADETIHVYPNAVVCVSTEGDLLKWTRMD